MEYTVSMCIKNLFFYSLKVYVVVKEKSTSLQNLNKMGESLRFLRVQKSKLYQKP